MKFEYLLIALLSVFASTANAQIDFMSDLDSTSRSFLSTRKADDGISTISRYRWKDQELEITYGKKFIVECKKNGSWSHEIDASTKLDAYGSYRIRALFSENTDMIYVLYPPMNYGGFGMTKSLEKQYELDNLFTFHAISKDGDLTKKEVKHKDLSNGSGKKIELNDIISVSHMIYHEGTVFVNVNIKNKKTFESLIVKIDPDMNVSSFVIDSSPREVKRADDYNLNLVKVENDVVWMVKSRRKGQTGSFDLKQINLTTETVLNTQSFDVDLSDVRLLMASNGMNHNSPVSSHLNDDYLVHSTATALGPVIVGKIEEKIQYTREDIDISYFSNCTINEDELIIYGFDGSVEDTAAANIWYTSIDLNSTESAPSKPSLIKLDESFNPVYQYAPLTLCYGYLKKGLFVFRIFETAKSGGEQKGIEQFVEIPKN